MIEVVIDFNKCPTNKKDFILCLCDIFNIPRVFGWDAFKDNLWDMMTKEIPKYYKYDPNDEWGWRDYHDYEIYVSIDRALGVKNENGTRDDIKLILRNFYPFYKKYKSIADDFLDIFLDVVNRSPKNSKESDDWYQMIMCIES